MFKVEVRVQGVLHRHPAVSAGLFVTPSGGWRPGTLSKLLQCPGQLRISGWRLETMFPLPASDSQHGALCSLRVAHCVSDGASRIFQVARVPVCPEGPRPCWRAGMPCSLVLLQGLSREPCKTPGRPSFLGTLLPVGWDSVSPVVAGAAHSTQLAAHSLWSLTNSSDY